MVEMKGMRRDELDKTKEDANGGTKQMWAGIKGKLWANKQERHTRE